MFGIKTAIKKYYYRKIHKMDDNEYNIMILRKSGCKIGEDCRIFSYELGGKEAWAITIGDRTTISTDVKFCTHDNAVIKLFGEKGTDVFGEIKVGSDCFIGMNSILMYGITIGDRCIIGAGSVVTKNIPEGTVWGGNPAKFICTVEEYRDKTKDKVFEYSSSKELEGYFKEHPEKLVVR